MKRKHKILWIVFGVALLSIPAWVWQSKKIMLRLTDLGPVPNFSLVDQNNAPFTADKLHGKIWVADFIFVHCPDICPVLTRQMKKLQDRLIAENIDDVRLVSFSVDPARDKPALLKDYATSQGVDERRWTFLTGESEALRETIISGFKISMGKEQREDNPELFEIVHGNRFVLVDRKGKIRGYFDVTEDTGLQSLWEAIEALR